MADVLVVDDSRLARAVARQALTRAGMGVREAGSVAGALEVIHAGVQVDLVLLDWNMPGGNGLELVYALRAETATADLPIVFATSEADPQRAHYAASAGADGYIVKPYRPEQLLAVIEPLLGRG